MPNHITNRISFQGDPEAIHRMLEAVKNEEEGYGSIDFNNDRKNKDNFTWPGINTIARDLSLSRSTVKRAIQDLETAGLVRKEAHYRANGSAASNRYYLIAQGNQA